MDVLKVFDEKLSGYCLTVFVVTQSDTPIEIAGEEAKNRGSNEQYTHEIETLKGAISDDEMILMRSLANLMGEKNMMKYISLIEESKFEDENTYYVIIVDRLGRSSLVQIIMGANSHISILLLMVEDDDSHSYIIMIEKICEEIDMNYFAINNIEQFLLQFMFYSNLEDKVLFEAWSIIVNKDGPEAGRTVGLGAKPQRGPRTRWPNTRLAWDPG
uniref:Uncharacterized protein n=1 Tax=Solanum tuberosum TaxID=4113 RepID=M1D9N9_SOLTU